MSSGSVYQKEQIVKLLGELSDLTGRFYSVEVLENGDKCLVDHHSFFSRRIYATTYKDLRFMIQEIVNMMKLSNQWTSSKITSCV